jgi:hypothetical protein
VSQQAQQILMSMPRLALSDGTPVGRIECGTARGGFAFSRPPPASSDRTRPGELLYAAMRPTQRIGSGEFPRAAYQAA